MLKKIFVLSAFLSFILVSGTFSQEVKPLSMIKEVEQLKETNKGKVMLINFWATWCKPCVKEFPELVKLYGNYKDKGFELVFISVDVPEEIESKVVPFLKKQNVDFVSYYNKFDKPEDLINYIDKNWEGAIPSTYIYDKEGKLAAHILGSKTYEDFEKEILKSLN